MNRVMVSGCFDGLHAGHVSFLQEAAGFGKELIVVVGTDANIRLLKGDKRPIFPLDERVFMLRALRCVKRVLVASGQGPIDFIPELLEYLPDYFVVNEDGHSDLKQRHVQMRGVEYRVLNKRSYSQFPHRSTTQIYQ